MNTTNTPMNRPNVSFAPGPLILGAMILAAALTRVMPHPWNFSPVEAIALFGGAYFASRSLAIVVPLVAMFASDLALSSIHGGTYATYFGSMSFWLVYACITLSSVLGFGLRGKVNGVRVLGYSLMGSVLFFLVTNFAAWIGSSMYPQNAAGLLAAYIAGVPFFQGTLLGTLFFSALLFGGFSLLRHRMPALRAQTV
jgi:hypothetical protein